MTVVVVPKRCGEHLEPIQPAVHALVPPSDYTVAHLFPLGIRLRDSHNREVMHMFILFILEVNNYQLCSGDNEPAIKVL